MGRMGGISRAMKQQRQKIATRTGTPISKVSPRRAFDSTGLRKEAYLQIGNPKRQTKPGFEVQIRPGLVRRFGQGKGLRAQDVDKALKLMRRYDPKKEEISHGRRRIGRK